MVLTSAFVTAFYIFRMIFMTFHGKPRLSAQKQSNLKESPITILVPLILLAVVAMLSGLLFFKLALTPNQLDHNGIFGNTISQYLQPALGNITVVSAIASEAQTKTPWDFIIHSIHSIAFWLALSGVFLAYILYVLFPKVPKLFTKMKSGVGIIHFILVKKYFIEYFYDIVFVKGLLLLSKFFWVVIDIFMIDKVAVHGSAKLIHFTGSKLRKIQRGYIFDYALVLLIGVLGLMLWLVFWVNA